MQLTNLTWFECFIDGLSAMPAHVARARHRTNTLVLALLIWNYILRWVSVGYVQGEERDMPCVAEGEVTPRTGWDELVSADVEFESPASGGDILVPPFCGDTDVTDVEADLSTRGSAY
jgi:hypothetical protein